MDKYIDMKKKKENFYDDYDLKFRRFHQDLAKHIKKLGWKSVYYSILKHQDKAVKPTGYILKEQNP